MSDLILSVVIPSYKDPLLMKTVGSLLDNSELDGLEVIAVLDGYEPKEPLKEDKRLKVIHLKENKGMRGAINAGLAEARGEFIMKTDSHCLFGPGFDRILAEDCKENWLMIPRRYPLHVDEWRVGRGYIKDYHYLSFPTDSTYGFGTFPIEWRSRTYERLNDPKYVIDDTMTFQGSCYFANREYFMERVGFLEDNEYSSFFDEPLEVGLKYWLGGGEVRVTKKTHYAHLFKNANYYKREDSTPRGYKLNRHTRERHSRATKRWLTDSEPNMLHPFSWLIEKFWPVPGWEDNWQKVLEDKW